MGDDRLQSAAGTSSLDDPASESQRIDQRIIDEFGAQTQDFMALYASPTITVTTRSSAAR